MFDFLKRFFKHIIVKSIILTILPAAYTTIFSIAFNNNDKIRRNLIILAIACTVFHIIALVSYGWIENKNRIKLDELLRDKDTAPKEIEALESLLNSYETSIYDNADRMYKTIHASQGHSEIVDWGWIEKIGDKICESIFIFLEKISPQGCRLAVSIILRKVSNSVSGYTMSSRRASENGYTPALYKDFVSEKEAEDKFYHKLITKSPGKPTVLHNKREIKKHFKDRVDEYSQYIAIPIECSGRKTIGILQVAVYAGPSILHDPKELDRIVNNYLDLGSKIMLLADKTENIHQIL